MNSIPRVVFPVPAPPYTRMTLPRRRPPDRMSSSPAMPVATRSRSAVVECPFQEAGAKQSVEGARDLRELVADVGCELLAAEDDPRMSREEEQQVEVAGVAQTGRVHEPQRHRVRRGDILNADAPLDGHHDWHRARLRALHPKPAMVTAQGLAARGGNHCDEPVAASGRNEMPPRDRDRGTPIRRAR